MGLITCFSLALQHGGQSKPWNSGEVIGLLVGFVVISILLVLWENFQGERAMVVPRLFKMRSIWPGSGFQFCFTSSYFLLLYYLPIYFQSIDNLSAVGSGIRNLPMVISVTIGGIIGGILVSKTGHATPFMVFGAAMATVGTGLIYTCKLNPSQDISQVSLDILSQRMTLLISFKNSGHRNQFREMDRVSNYLRSCNQYLVPTNRQYRPSQCLTERHVISNRNDFL